MQIIAYARQVSCQRLVIVRQNPRTTSSLYHSLLRGFLQWQCDPALHRNNAYRALQHAQSFRKDDAVMLVRLRAPKPLSVPTLTTIQTAQRSQHWQ